MAATSDNKSLQTQGNCLFLTFNLQPPLLGGCRDSQNRDKGETGGTEAIYVRGCSHEILFKMNMKKRFLKGSGGFLPRAPAALYEITLSQELDPSQ